MAAKWYECEMIWEIMKKVMLKIYLLKRENLALNPSQVWNK